MISVYRLIIVILTLLGLIVLSALNILQLIMIIYVFPNCEHNDVDLVNYIINPTILDLCLMPIMNTSLNTAIDEYSVWFYERNTYCYETNSFMRSIYANIIMFQIVPIILFPIVPSCATCIVPLRNRKHFVECFTVATAVAYIMIHMFFLWFSPCVLRNGYFMLYMTLLVLSVSLLCTVYSLHLCKSRCSSTNSVVDESDDITIDIFNNQHLENHAAYGSNNDNDNFGFDIIDGDI